MELFKTLNESLPEGVNTTIVVRKNAGGKMTVITNFSNEKGGQWEGLAPFTLKGTADELDTGFVDAIKEPVATVSGLVSNIEAFKKSAEDAKKNAEAAAKKPAAAAKPNDAAKKAEEERKKKEAEAKAKKDNFDKAVAKAKDENAHGNYNLAQALLGFAAENTDDKKVKAELEKQIKAIEPNKSGFLCNDNADNAKAALEAFKGSLKVESPVEAPTAEPEEVTNPTEETAEEE